MATQLGGKYDTRTPSGRISQELREAGVPYLQCSAALLYLYSPLKLLFLLLAAGIILTDTKYITFVATRIRHAPRLMRPTVPDHAANTLLVLLTLPTVGFAILTLRQPPDFVLALNNYFGDPGRIWITWSALMSVGAAFFGAISHAAWRAVDTRPLDPAP